MERTPLAGRLAGSGYSEPGMGKSVVSTPERAKMTTATRWYNIERARIMLDYEPLVGVEEGIKRAVAVRRLPFHPELVR